MITGLIVMVVAIQTICEANMYIPSRGRSGMIHQFYDQRVQTLRPYMFVDLQHSTMNLASEAKGGSTLTRAVTKSYSEYVDTLKLGGEARLDLLLNIFEGGLHTEADVSVVARSKSTSVYAFVEIFQKTKEIKTNLCDPRWKNFAKLDLLSSSDVHPTHVIAGKTFGLYLEVILEVEDVEGESSSEIQVQFQAELDSFLATLDAKINMTKNTSSKSYLSRSKIRTYCNLVNCPTPPQSLDQLEQFIKNSYQTMALETSVEGNEISYIAVDIRDLQTCWNFSSSDTESSRRHEITGENVNLIEIVVKEIETSVSELYKFEKKMHAYKQCLPHWIDSNITREASSAIANANLFRSQVKRLVINVRYGRRNQTKLEKKVQRFRQGHKNPDRVLQRLRQEYYSWERKIDFYSSASKVNVTCLPTTSNLLTMYADSRDDIILYLLMNNRTLNDDFINNLRSFTSICNERCSNCTCYLADCFFPFSFCQNSSNGIYKYTDGKLSIVNSATHVNYTSTEFTKLKAAVLYLYIDNAKTLKMLRVVNKKVDLYYNETIEAIQKNLRNPHNFLKMTDLDSSLDHDSIGRIRSNRTVMNPVETFFGNFIDLGQ